MKRSIPKRSKCPTLKSPRSTSSATLSMATGTTRSHLGEKLIDLFIYGQLLRLPQGAFAHDQLRRLGPCHASIRRLPPEERRAHKQLLEDRKRLQLIAVICDRFTCSDVASLGKVMQAVMSVTSQVADQRSVGEQCKAQGHDGGRGNFGEPWFPGKSLQPNEKGQKHGNDEHLAGFDAEVKPDECGKEPACWQANLGESSG